MKLTFWGAARTVTGSTHLLETKQTKVFLDCGLYHGRRKEAEERNRSFPFHPREVDAVVLSHAHIDHSGNLPTFHRMGFNGPIYATAATVDLCEAMLKDSAFVQEKDCEFVNKRRRRRQLLQLAEDEGERACPLYTVEDAEATIPLFRSVELNADTPLAPGLTFRLGEAGHMLGSAFVIVEEKRGNHRVRLGFSGDVGRPGLPIIRDPATMPAVDYLILESTYGDRLHKPLEAVQDKLADVICRTAARGGKIIAPAFAVGRTQQLVLMIHELLEQRRIPSIPIYVDSPLAVDVTQVFRKHSYLFDEQTRRFLENGSDPFGFRLLRYVRDVEQSKALNDLRGPYLVISASGMCEAGRILHHLRNGIEDSRNTILITGFQAENTLGRKIVEKMPEVPVFGELMRLRAEVVKINELSGHADQHELVEWIRPLAQGLKTVFLVHGEDLQQRSLAQAIERAYGVPVRIPARGETFSLD
ncbi:MAG: MBL fold metallo-hydrolase [Bryobacteraceae bacterium]|nr:MBL fold metallo-hydrolase [Bryobacteraceae bacterium]MDW8377607.1 MBL fold metallo-hydrolase [Bryobacterales bacterium]